MRNRILLLALILYSAPLASRLFADDIYNFTTLPAGGNISGAAGSVIGWGYSITNESATDWLLATNLNADSFAFGTPVLLFDFPEVAPGATVTESFDPVGGTGLYEDMLSAYAAAGSADSGNFVLSAQWYDGDPFNGGNLIADAIDSSAPYTATVTVISATPEPASLPLIATLLAALGVVKASKTGWFKRRPLLALKRHH